MEILPVLDTEVLKQKATEFAMKGAIKSIEDYYSGYNSPFMKVITEQISKSEIGSGIELPDIIALINESLSKEIDIIANTAISKTFVPLVQRFLVREKKEIKFSEILETFIEKYKNDDAVDFDDFRCDIQKNGKYDFLDIKITTGHDKYEITFHQDYDSRKEEIKKYQILSLPRDKSQYSTTMKIAIDGATLEMPFTKDILKDEFISFIARLIIANSKITMDCTDFNGDMFPERCHC